jgi:hypothetical protein
MAEQPQPGSRRPVDKSDGVEKRWRSQGVSVVSSTAAMGSCYQVLMRPELVSQINVAEPALSQGSATVSGVGQLFGYASSLPPTSNQPQVDASDAPAVLGGVDRDRQLRPPDRSALRAGLQPAPSLAKISSWRSIWTPVRYDGIDRITRQR